MVGDGNDLIFPFETFLFDLIEIIICGMVESFSFYLFCNFCDFYN